MVRKILLSSISLFAVLCAYAKDIQVSDFLGEYKNLVSCKDNETTYNRNGWNKMGLKITVSDEVKGLLIQKCDQESDWCPVSTPYPHLGIKGVHLEYSNELGYEHDYHIRSIFIDNTIIRQEYTKSSLFKWIEDEYTTSKITLKDNGNIELWTRGRMTCTYSKK